MNHLVRVGLVAFVFIALHAGPARAHTVGVSRGEYHVAGSTVGVDLVFARADLTAAVPGLDADRDGSLSAVEVAGSGRLLEGAIVHALEVRAPSGSCSGRFTNAALTEEDGLAIRAIYQCGGDARPLSLRLGFLGALSLGHRHIAAATAAHTDPVRAVVYEARPGLEVGAPQGPTPGGARSVAWPLFRLGIQHILTGYDHLLFLLGLILVGGRLRSLLVVVTAFTLAHSVTLGMAALGLWAPSPRVVEPAIALSIIYVGIENWFVRDAGRRWLITFPFGLIHGFGFAGALKEISLPSADVPLALASFNVGVEVGQLAVLAFVLPLVLWLGRSRWFADRGVKAMSTAIAFAGLCWFVSRLA